MATIINAGQTALTITPDATGALTLQANGVTALTANTTGYLNFAKQPQIGGVEWPAFSAYKNSSTQSFTQNTPTKVTFDVEDFDTNNNFASSRFTPTVAGYYQINAGLDVGASSSALNRADIYIFKNGSNWKVGNATYSGFTGTEIGLVASSLVYCNGSTDYIEIYVYVTGTNPIVYTGSPNTYFQGVLIRGS